MTYSGGNNERSRGQSHHGTSGLGSGRRKGLLRAITRLATVKKTAKEEAHSHNQEQVGENRSQHRGLDDLNLVIL